MRDRRFIHLSIRRHTTTETVRTVVVPCHASIETTPAARGSSLSLSPARTLTASLSIFPPGSTSLTRASPACPSIDPGKIANPIAPTAARITSAWTYRTVQYLHSRPGGCTVVALLRLADPAARSVGAASLAQPGGSGRNLRCALPPPALRL